MEQHSKPVEITQQQLSVVAAGVLMIAFFSFLVGYLATQGEGTHQASDLMSVFPSSRVVSAEVMIHRRLRESHADQSQHDEHSELKKNDDEYYACVAGFGTVEAARVYEERLKAVGVATEIVPRKSWTVAGVQRTWYQLITLPGTKKEIEQRARHIQKMMTERLLR